MGSFLGLLYKENDSFFLLLLPLFIFIHFLIKWLYPTTPAVTTKKLLPSPPKLPIVGNLHQLGSLPHRSLWALAQRHGPLMLLHFGRVPVVIVSAVDAAREIMKTNDAIFSNRPKSNISARLLYDYKDVSTAPYGEYWRQMRSICVLHLLSTRRVQSFRGVREEETALLMEKISSSSSSSIPIDLSQMFLSLTNDLICRVALGRKYSGDENGRKDRELLKEFGALLGCFNVGDYIPWLSWVNFINGLDAKVEKVAKEFDRFLDEVVKEHVERRKRGVDEEVKDFVDVLLGIQEDNVTGVAITGVCIKALTLDMFAAGSDTTYTVLEWAMTQLLRHPQVMRQLQNEVRGIAQGKLLITEDDLDKMEYLKAVIKETLRLHPPIPLLVPRESTRDAKIMGYDIAARTQVITNVWAIGRDPLLWDEAEKFRPERFLNSSIDFRGQDFELIPFGAGRRGCPGTLFAAMAIEVVLANLVHRFDWEVGGGSRREDLDMTECTGLTIHRKVPLLAVATPWPR
ncbi:cytochrome P450 71A2-like [Vitis riparia]|uniref:cytochrome P450 71A2-like n=1 Tax=Vitis riparia TaxID=96939 RepID=UPI00155A6EFE|nr:cytochrome P450 71A2-like [Vitis riparia]